MGLVAPPPGWEVTMSPLPTVRHASPAPVEPRPAGFAGTAVTKAMSLHVSKLRGMTVIMRRKLRRRGITYTDQLLAAAGAAAARKRLARAAEIDEETLTRLVERADLARIKGVGAIFADMLERLGVHRATELAGQDPADLHRRLQTLNATERFARRAPTPDEVRDWVGQAEALPPAVD